MAGGCTIPQIYDFLKMQSTLYIYISKLPCLIKRFPLSSLHELEGEFNASTIPATMTLANPQGSSTQLAHEYSIKLFKTFRCLEM